MFKGSIVALVTPMLADGTIDYTSLANLVEFHIEQGTDAIVSVGTTGESATLKNSEHIEVIKQTIRFANKRIAVIAGTGANATSEALELTTEAKKLGADACLLVVPYYNKPTSNGLIAHFSAIAKVPIPQILYNVPSRTVVDMLPETVIALSKIDNIVGIKEATGDIHRVATIKAQTDNFCLLTGDDPTCYQFMAAGGIGIISVTANIAPGLMRKMTHDLLAGNTTQAKQTDDILQPLHKALFVESNPIPVKYALQLMGKIDSGIRLPLTACEPENREIVKNCLKNTGII